MMAQRLAFGCWGALLLLHLTWHSTLAPPANGAVGLALAFALVPLLLPLTLVARRPTRALLWVGILGLFYFAHGVVAAWAVPTARLLGLAEAGLCAALIGCLGWFARTQRRRR